MEPANSSPRKTNADPADQAWVRAFFLTVGAGLLLLVGTAAWQVALVSASSPYGLLKTYPSPVAATNEEFGNAVDWLPSGNELIVGARGDRHGGASPIGAVYVLNTTTGAVTHVITNAESGANDYFGYAIAVSGTRVLIGAQLNSFGATNAGAAYLYDTGSGALIQTFHNPNPNTGDKFGSSVAIISDTAVLVGVPYSGTTSIGRAYICMIIDGTCPTAIDSPSGYPGGDFGLSVVALGDEFAVAAPLDQPFSSPHGKVYVFTTTTGSLYATITLPVTTTTTGDNFGSALASVNGDILIGAQFGGSSILNTSGAAYLYQPNGTLVRSFFNPDPNDGSARFGAAVAGDGNLLFIGAPGATGTFINEGRAYLYNSTTGVLVDTFQKASPAAGDQFGNAVAVMGENFLAGAQDDGLGATKAGAVYRFGAVPANFSGSSKTVNATAVRPGDLLTYTLMLSNSGTIAANFALTDTLDVHLSLVSAPGMSGGTILTATGVLSGLTQLNYIVTLRTSRPFSGTVANAAQLTGDGSLRNLNAPLVTVAQRLWLPVVRR